MEQHGFYYFRLSLEENLFDTLAENVDFEEVTKGRKGNHLVKSNEKGVPIVRTTTKYQQAAHCFSVAHDLIATAIQQKMQAFTLDFNHALIEIYGQDYTKMGYHSDQCLDLAAGSFIALFSCYAQPETLSVAALRKLKVKSKMTGEEFEFVLEHYSVVLFSLEMNAKFQHKIVLEAQPSETPVNQWLGITFRKSNTFLHFKENRPYFANGEPLQLADEQQSKTFYQLRKQENNSMDFRYPDLFYTLSEGDMLMPKMR